MRGLWSGLKGRMVLGYLVIFLISAAIVAGRAGNLYARTAVQGAALSLQAQAYVVALALAQPWTMLESGSLNPPAFPQLQDLPGGRQPGAGTQLSILDARGNTLATSLDSLPPNQRDRPEVAEALAGRVQYRIRVDPSTGQPSIYAAAPVQRQTRVLAVVQVSVPLAEVMAGVRQFWFSLGLTAGLAALAAMLVGWWLADQVVRPVGRLRDAAGLLAAGELDERVSPRHSGGVAEIAQLATAFNHMAERIQDMMNRQRAFVANASHELRTPLTNIKLRAEALGNGALDDPVIARRFAREIEVEADRLSRMANDLLALSRQDARPSLSRELVDPARAISEVMEQMSLRAREGGIALLQDVAPALPLLSADPVGLHTLLSNLLDNALQYTPPGGTITVAARTDDGGGQRRLVMQVADSGTGIPPEDLPHVFERFYRADKARSRRPAQMGSGAGLGLAIVKGIVAEHNGSATAESVPGQGTKVTVALPLGQGSIPQ